MDNKPPPYPGSYPPGAYPQQQGGYYPPPPQQSQQAYYPQPNIVVQPANPAIVVVGGDCPNCRIGVLADDYGCFAIFLAIFFFPLGVLCCLAMRERVCTHCGARY